MENCLISWGKYKLKTTVGSQFRSVRITKKKKKVVTANAGENLDKLDHSCNAGEDMKWYSSFGHVRPTTTTMWLSNCTLKTFIPEKCRLVANKYLHMNVLSSFIHIIPNWKQSTCPSLGELQNYSISTSWNTMYSDKNQHMQKSGWICRELGVRNANSQKSYIILL